MRVAICYFGLTRSLRKVVESHQRYLFETLKEGGIKFDIYVHTWIGSLIHRRGNDKDVYHCDPGESFVLNPDRVCIDNQDKFLQTITFSDYFYKDVFETYGEGRSTEWFPDLILYHICSVESQRRVISMARDSGIKYDKILMLRPDLLFSEAFPIEPFQECIEGLVFIPQNDSGEGYNDKLALFNASEIDAYASRGSRMKDYRATVGRIVGEKYLKYTLDTHGFRVLPLAISPTILRG